MAKKPQPGIECQNCHKLRVTTELMPLHELDRNVLDHVPIGQIEVTDSMMICRDCVNQARGQFVEASLTAERGGLSLLEREVIAAIQKHETVAENPLDEQSLRLTFGERMSDKLASFGGSWSFILFFGSVMAVWIFWNRELESAFDPFPFILLNLVLSCLAAIQAPIIMMSQNRLEKKDRQRSEADYKTNLKAELEIQHLNIKMDQLISQQWHRLLEIQKVQTDLLQDLTRHLHSQSDK